MSNAFLDCIHGHLENPRSDVTEQLYIITKLKRYDVEAIRKIFHTMLSKPDCPKPVAENLTRDGLPSREMVQKWLSTYGRNYPNWRRIREPGTCLVPVAIVVLGIVLTIVVANPEPVGWIAILLGLLVFAVVTRILVGRLWRFRMLKGIERDMRREGFNRSPAVLAATRDFDEFMQSWLLACRVGGDSRPAAEIARDALAIWDGTM